MPSFYRLGGVYGPGEAMVAHRMLRMLQMRFIMFLLCWDTDQKEDFVHIRNVVQAHLLVHFYMKYTLQMHKISLL